QREGPIRHVGLSEVTVEQIEAAQNYFQVVTVQNEFNLINRQSEQVLDYCERHGIGFIPWYPLAGGPLASGGGVLDQIAKRHGRTPSQIALAWLLQRSPVMLPIPGTSKVKHLEENIAAVEIELSASDVAALNELAS